MKKIMIEELVSGVEVLTEYEMMKQFKNNNIVKERVELYRDFVINLVYYVHTTYLGVEYLKSEDDIIGHYNWAFNKVLSDLNEEEIVFANTSEIKKYFFEFFLERFYNADNIPSLKYFIYFWDAIFSLKSKDKLLVTTLIEMYKLFDKGFTEKKSEKNIVL
jgi:hypothetical protein